MDYRLRKDANPETWCSLLLPFCLFPFVIKHGLGIYLFFFNICLCTCLAPITKSTQIFNPLSWIVHIMLSLPPSFFMWHFFSYNFVVSCLLCSWATWYYSYVLNCLIVRCPSSFTIGEAQIISQGIMLFVVGCLISILSELKQLHNFPLIEIKTPSVYCMQILLLGCLLLIHTLCMIPVLTNIIQFLATCGIFSCIMLYAWSIQLKKNVFSWMLSFCLVNQSRMYLISFWVLCTVLSITIVVVTNKKTTKKASTLVRKYFHLVINVVYLSGFVYDQELLRLASGIALTAFLVLEMFRILKIPIVGPAIETSFQVFLDEKDSGVLILTHIYLLVGCSAPIWIASYVYGKGYHICLLSGIISVGFGDTAAAVGGTTFGKHHWRGSKKTIEGSACSFLVQMVVSFILLSYSHECTFYNAVLTIVAVLLTTLLEAKTTQVDNLVLPLFMFSFLSWIY